MPKVVKLLILSHEGRMTDAEKARIRGQLPQDFEYHITELKAGNVQITADLIKKSYSDVVICAKNLELSPWALADECASLVPDRQGPKFIIDGAIEDILDREFKNSLFSGSVGIVKRDPVSQTTVMQYKKSYRMANDGAPNAIGTRFNIASNTKMMTSIAIAKMVEAGHLALDTPIHQSLTNVACAPFYKTVFASIPRVTPRQLLSHTSGLNDGMGTIFENQLGPQMIGFSSVRDYVEHFSSFDKPFDVNDSAFNYCNFGYELLGLAIEAVTGNYYQYLKDNVLDPAGMEHTVPLRQPGDGFAAPFYSSPTIPVPATLHNPDDEVRLLEEKTRPFLEYAQTFSGHIDSMNTLIAEYRRGLATCPLDKWEDFKAEMIGKITPIFEALKNPAHAEIIKKIEDLGSPLHDRVMAMETGDPNNPQLPNLRKIDALFYNLHEYLLAKPLMSILNSLSKASPDGRNMYSTVEDMLKFERAITTGALSPYMGHLESETAPSNPANPSFRYGFGCFIEGRKNEPEYTIAHGGDAPGMHAAFRMHPNQGYTVVALANNEESQQFMANSVQRHLIFGKQQSMFYLDQRVDPDVTQSLRSAINERAFLERTIRQAHVPGVSVSRLSHGGNIATEAAGVINTDTREAVTDSTVFQAASLSKPVFAYIVLKMVERGMFSRPGETPQSGLDRPLYEIGHFGPPHLRDHPNYKLLTPRNLLSHQASLPNWFKLGEPEAYVVAADVATVGTRFDYSGLAYCFLNEVVEHVAGGYDLGLMSETKRDPRKIYLEPTTEGLQYEVIGLDGALKQNTIPWDKLPEYFPRNPSDIVHSQVGLTPILLDYTSKAGHTLAGKPLPELSREVFDDEPLRMNHTSFVPFPEESAEQTKRAIGHKADGSPDKRVPSLPIRSNPAASLVTTAEDYAKFLNACLHDDFIRGHMFEPQPQLSLAGRDQKAMDAKVPEETLRQMGWGIGMGLQTADNGDPIAFHWGDNETSRAFTAINLRTNEAVACFTNSANGPAIFRQIAEPVVGDLSPICQWLSQREGLNLGINPAVLYRGAMSAVKAAGAAEVSESASVSLNPLRTTLKPTD